MRKFFDSIVKPVDRGSTDSLYLLFRFAAIASVLVFIAAFIILFAEKEAGQFGDFIGGTLNPILTFLTFMGLIVTIVLQQQELADTRVELKKSADALEKQSEALDNQLKAIHRQNFEATFFQMLSFHNNLVGAMDIQLRNGMVIKGRDCFKHFYKSLKEQYEGYLHEDEKKRIEEGHRNFWKEFQQDLAHYYRYLYNIIRFIEESDVDPQKYMRIVRALLSNYELAVMFYNGLTKQAEKSKVYIERYALFDNLPDELLFSGEHMSYYEVAAYNEDQARLASAAIRTFLDGTSKTFSK
ncbi:putative phage abortive infection protein [Shinella pollutisoli]|uniref:Phage abortive infection protein n=1 Tax=Shinella pollutisoli TaxID=2250594 RepID=A0ABV7DNI0_9HYPH|nr:putative phage abortive infection protein [Shinella pollutisoli]